MILHHTYLEENSPSELLFPSTILKKVEEEKEQTKVYGHVMTSTHLVKKQTCYLSSHKYNLGTYEQQQGEANCMHITTSSLLFNDTFFRCKISINIQCLN